MSERVLWLLRHAKAAESPPPGGADHDRRLANRGRRDAEALGRKLATLASEMDGAPQLVLCSSARRTTETAELVAAAGDLSVLVDRRRRLYYGSPDDLLDEVRAVDDGLRSVLLVGHNPAVASLAGSLLAETGAAGLWALSGGGFPTCALAVVALPADGWAGIAPGTGTLRGFFKPPY